MHPEILKSFAICQQRGKGLMAGRHDLDAPCRQTNLQFDSTLPIYSLDFKLAPLAGCK